VRALLLIPAALLAAGIYAAAQRGLADAYYLSARGALSGLSEAAPADETLLAHAEAALRSAIASEPSNPIFTEQLGRVHELRALRAKRGDPVGRDALKQSLEQYRIAARMRPGSPYAWASIAMLKFGLDDMDFEFYGALERAARLGPWEPGVQLALADIGFAGWRLLAQPARKWVIGAIERALPKQEAELRRIANMHRSLPIICADPLAAAPDVSRLCRPR
jgi:hypothetical protein